MQVPAERSILHVDMDAFFASVEQLDSPSLRGKPVLVGYDGPRGVVAAASYEARTFGCHSAQPMSVAKRLCPHAAVVPVHFSRYREVSARVFAIFERYTPLVEPLSIDEAFLDLTGGERLQGPAQPLAARLKAEILAQTSLTASIGVAPNKFLAKLASDLRKPDGLTVIRAQDVENVLGPLPITRIWGIGPKTAARIQGLGVKTIGELRRLPPEVLARRIGSDAEHYLRLAAGLDDRPVVSDRQAKSIGQEQTFGQDLIDPDAVRSVLLEQAEQVGTRLRRHAVRARAIVVKIRFGDFQTLTRRTMLPEPTHSTDVLWRAARELFNRWAAKFQPVRLIGVTATALSRDAPQLELFADPDAERRSRVDQAVDKINSRFGRPIVHRGRTQGGK